MPGVPTHLHSNLPGNGQRSGEKSKDGGRNNANVPKGLRKRTPKEANHKTGGGVQRQLRDTQNTDDRPAGTQTPSMHTTSRKTRPGGDARRTNQDQPREQQRTVLVHARTGDTTHREDTTQKNTEAPHHRGANQWLAEKHEKQYKNAT